MAEERKPLLELEDNPIRTNKWKGTLTGICITYLYVLSSLTGLTSVQLLQRSIPDFQLNALRFCTGFIATSLYLAWKRKLPRIPYSEIKTVVLFSVIVVMETTGYFIAATFLPVATLTSIITVANIFGSLLLLPVCGIEKLRPSMIGAAIFCTIGVVLVLQPDFIFHSTPTGTAAGTSNISLENTSTLEPEILGSSQPNALWLNDLPVASDPPPDGNVTTGNHHPNINKSDSTFSFPFPVYVTGHRKSINVEHYGNTSILQGHHGTSSHLEEQYRNSSIMTSPYITQNETGNLRAVSDSIDNLDGNVINIIKYVLSIITGLVLSLEMIILKKKPFLIDSLPEVLFWLWLAGALFSLVVMGITETPVLPTTLFDISMITFHCLSVVVIWPSYICACKYISGQIFTIIISTSPMFLLIPQYTVLSPILPGHKNWIEVVGVFLVLIASAMGAIIELMKQNRRH